MEIRGAGVNEVVVSSLPTRINITVLLKAVGLPTDFLESAPRNVEVYLLGPGMEAVDSLNFDIPHGEPGEGYEEGWEIWQFVPVALRFTVTQPGHHMIDIYLNSRHCKALPLKVSAPN
ncbi:MAG: hypothetical protein ACRDMU_04820 [Gaiellaceae bacterium]